MSDLGRRRAVRLGLVTRRTASAGAAPAAHAFLGTRLPGALPTVRFESRVGAERHSLVRDADGAPTMPPAACLAVALAAAQEVLGSRVTSLENVRFEAPLVFAGTAERTMRVTVSTAPARLASFEIHSREVAERTWIRHAVGDVGRSGPHRPVASPVSSLAVWKRCGQAREAGTVVRSGRPGAFEHRPGQRAVERLWRRDGEALALLRLPPAFAARAEDHRLHPALIEAALEVLAATVPGDGADAYTPTGIEALRLHGRPRRAREDGPLWTHAVLRTFDGGVLEGDVRLLETDVRLLEATDYVGAEIVGARLARVPPDPAVAPDLRTPCLATPPEGREAFVEARLRGEVAALLGIDPRDVDPAEPVTRLGLDSLVTFEFKEKLENAFRITLDLERFVSAPTIAGLAAYVVAEVAPEAPSRVARPS